MVLEEWKVNGMPMVLDDIRNRGPQLAGRVITSISSSETIKTPAIFALVEKKKHFLPDVVAHASDLSAQEPEAGRSLVLYFEMSRKSWTFTKASPSPRLIPEWKNLKSTIYDILKDSEIHKEIRKSVSVLSDLPRILYHESYNLQKTPFMSFYSLDTNYIVAFNWLEYYERQTHAVLWTQEKGLREERKVTKTKFPLMDEVPPITSMVHVASYCLLIAYCEDVHLRLFGDHHQEFIALSTVPCHFFISCLCYDSETEVLSSGTLGAVVTWFIVANGKSLQMAHRVALNSLELVQDLYMSTSMGSLIALCESVVRIFTHKGQGQLKEVKTLTVLSSGFSLTCSCSCVPQNAFYAGNKNGEVHVWDLDNSKFLNSFTAHPSPVISIYSQPETYTLFTAGSDGMLKEWNLTSGNLLRQLIVGTDLQQLRFIDNSTFFCQSTSSFSLYLLPHFYNLFNICGSAPQKIQRIFCGHNCTRILCATEDGLLRFLSPVTGDLLIVTWPLLAMDKAVAWAYHSEREELFVAIGSSELLVFDTTRSPCPAKYLLCTSENYNDKIKCLAYGGSRLVDRKKGLMFCGHESGIVRILSQDCSIRTEKTIHSGAVLALCTPEGFEGSSLVCSYGKDNYIHLTKAVPSEKRMDLQPMTAIVCLHPLKHVVLLPGSVGAITEHSCWLLWHYQDFTKAASQSSAMVRHSTSLHECAITSFDICLSLKLFVTGATDGSVRVWNFHGKLVAQFESELHFSSPCFANSRGDLLLTFNQSIYLVSCLKLLPLSYLLNLSMLTLDEDMVETPRPFLPSFFFLFELIFVPKFIYMEQSVQELQGLESLINKRAIAFDDIVPHVVEEGRHTSITTQERPGLYFVQKKYIDFSMSDARMKYPDAVPAQLQVPGWDGLNSYRLLQGFFGKGQKWPFAPDCYIPNSVIRARLWPDGTPVFLCYDLCLSYEQMAEEVPETLRIHPVQSLSPDDTEMRARKLKDIYQEQKRESYGILERMSNKSWMGKKFSDGIIENMVETILNLTVFCSTEKYKKYFNALVEIFLTHQVPSRMRIETACRLLKDITHYNASIREMAWEMLERLGFISQVFTVPLIMGLMDSEQAVRAKVVQLLSKYTGIQSKAMLLHQLRQQHVYQELEEEVADDLDLSHILSVRHSDLQDLHGCVKERLNEDLSLSNRAGSLRFSIDLEKNLEMSDKETFIPVSDSKMIDGLKKRKKHVQNKTRKLVRGTLKISKRSKKTELQKEPLETGVEQRKARKVMQVDTKDGSLMPELPLSFDKTQEETQEITEVKEAFIDKEAKVDLGVKGVLAVKRTLRAKRALRVKAALRAKAALGVKRALGAEKALGAGEASRAKEALGVEEVLGAKEALEAEEALGAEEALAALGATDKDVSLKPKTQTSLQKPWKTEKENIPQKEESKESISELTEKALKELQKKLPPPAQVDKDKGSKPVKPSHGMAGIPGRMIPSHERKSWREDICHLVTSRIASSHPGMERDLGKELEDFADKVLTDQPSWDLFTDLCPWRKISYTLPPEPEIAVQERPVRKRKVPKRAIKGEVTTDADQEGISIRKKHDIFPKDKTKRTDFLDSHMILEKKKPKELTMEEVKTATEEKRLQRQEEKPHREKRKTLTEEGTSTLEKRIRELEKTMEAHKEDMGDRKQGTLSPVRKKEKEKRELGMDKGELAREGKELIQDTEGKVGKQAQKKRLQDWGSERTEEEDYRELRMPSEVESKKILEMESLTKQDDILAQKKDWSAKEKIKKDRFVRAKDEQQQEEWQEPEMGQEKKEEEKAKEKKHLAQESKKLDLEENEWFEKMRKLFPKVSPRGKQESKLQLRKRKAWKRVQMSDEEGRTSWGVEEVKLARGEKDREETETKGEQEKQKKQEEKKLRKQEQATEEGKRWRSEEEQAVTIRGKPYWKVEKEPEKTKIQPREKPTLVSEGEIIQKPWAAGKKKYPMKKERLIIKGKEIFEKGKERPILQDKKGRLQTQEEEKVMFMKEDHLRAKERMRLGKEKTEITQIEEQSKKKQGKLFQQERKLSSRIKQKHVARYWRKPREERKPAVEEQAVESRVGLKEIEAGAKDKRGVIGKTMLRALAGLRVLSSMPLKKTDMPEEERLSIMRIYDHEREVLKKQELKTEEEREQAEEEGDVVTQESQLEEDYRLLEEYKEVFLDRAQVETLLKKFQEAELLGQSQLVELLKHLEVSKSGKIQLGRLLENIRESLEEEMEEGLTHPEGAGKTKEEKKKKSLEEEEEAVPKKKRYLKEKGSFGKEDSQKLTEEQRERRLTLKGKQEKRLVEKIKRLGTQEGLGKEKKEERFIQEELGHPGKEDKARELEKRILSEEEESLDQESLREAIQSGKILSKESQKKKMLIEERLQDEEWSLGEGQSPSELLSLSDSETLDGYKRLSGEELSLSEEESLKVENLAEEKEGAAGWQTLLRDEGLLEEERDSRFMDKSHLTAPQMSPQGKLGLFLKELKKRWENRFLEADSRASSQRRQETGILEEDRKQFSQATGTGLKTQIPELPYGPHLELPISLQPQKPKGDKSNWVLQYQDIPLEKTRSQAVPLTPAPSPKRSTEGYPSPIYTETYISDEDWINNTLRRLEAGEQVSKESYYQLHHYLEGVLELYSPSYWEGNQLSTLKAIVQHLQLNQDAGQTPQPSKGIFIPTHLKETPPVKRKEGWQTLPSVPELKIISATQAQKQEAFSWDHLAKTYREKPAQQLSTAIKDAEHIYPTRRDVLRDDYPIVDRKSLAVPKSEPLLPLITSRATDSKEVNWQLFNESHRSTRRQQLLDSLKEIEMRQFYPAQRNILMGDYEFVHRQTSALVFQRELKALKEKSRHPKLARLKKTMAISKEREALPSWNTFVALFHVLQMLQQRYAKDRATWMENFYQLMDLYQIKSPRIQKLLLDLLLSRETQPQEFVSKEALKALELVPGERLFYRLVCGGSQVPDHSLKFWNVIPLSGQNRVDTVQAVGIAKYGFLELAWKSLPQVKPYLVKKLPSTAPNTH
ncbi:WD repeat-containing protein 87-like [Mastomys coucha]|uniref:WD repeat-containing protein 87-like n=1 Tax=Mastomys coucha TaxID=35658 RepID=UPI001261B63C|nr:WD repeat-containing protein 87-like [Mastomys coucha]